MPPAFLTPTPLLGGRAKSLSDQIKNPPHGGYLIWWAMRETARLHSFSKQASAIELADRTPDLKCFAFMPGVQLRRQTKSPSFRMDCLFGGR